MATGGKGLSPQWLNGSALGERRAFVQFSKTCEDEFNIRTCPRLDSLGQDWVLLNLLLGTSPGLNCTTEFDDETAIQIIDIE